MRIAATTTAISATFNEAAAADDYLIVSLGWHTDTGDVLTIFDTFGGAYSVVASIRRGTGLSQVMYAARQVLPTVTNAISVMFTTAVTDVSMRLILVRGVAAGGMMGNAFGTGTSCSAGPVFVLTPNTLVLASNTASVATASVGAGQTTILTTQNGDRVTAMTTSATTTQQMSLTSAGNCVMQAITLPP